MTAVVIRKTRCESPRGVDRLAGLAGAIQLDVSDAQAHVGQRQLGIVLQRDVKRAGGFDPGVRVQVCQSLVVEGLRFLG